MQKAVRNLLFITLLMLTGWTNAQSDATLNLAQTKLLEVYSQESIDETHNSNPALYDYLMSVAVYKPLIINGLEPKYESQNDNSTTITKNKVEISIESFYSDLQQEKFNLLNYSIKPGMNSIVFKVNEGTYVIIESQKDVLQKYKSK